MEIIEDDAIKCRAAEVAKLVHSVIDIPHSPFGTPPLREESTQKIHFGIRDAFAKSIRAEDYHKYYEPRLVSIGPFYYGKPHLAPMENFKRQAVRKLAERKKVSIEEAYANVEQDLLRIAKECYDVSRFSDPEWCQMMFLDCCFVIEFVENFSIRIRRMSWLSIMKQHDRDLVHRDLLLLENQLPSQVLLVLARAFKYEVDLENLTFPFIFWSLIMIFSAPTAASKLFYYINIFNLVYRIQVRNVISSGHLLQQCRDTLVSLLFIDDEKEEEENHFAVCPPFSVTELKKVGIRCTTDHPDCSSPNICFKSSILSGHLFLQPLTINEWTVTLFSNLIAYEDSCSMLRRRSSGISSYLNFMCMLINGEEDVKELRARGILKVNFKDDDKLINFLRDITAHTESNHKVIRNVKRQISNYFENKRLSLRIGYAELKQRYFSGPWSFLVFSVSMTVIQTILTGIQTYK